MRITGCVVALAIVSAGIARAQQPPPQYPPPQYAPQPQYAPPTPQQANPLDDPARYARWEHTRHTSHNLRLGGRVALGIGIPFFLIGMSVGVVAVYTNGIYLCSGISCDRNAAAGVGFTMAVLGAAGIGGGIAMLVLANRYYDESERIRMGLAAMKYVPSVAPLARADGHGFDGAAVAWGLRV